MSNDDSPVSQTGDAGMQQPAAQTAYMGQTATRYDEARFVTKTGRVMHAVEWVCLADALKRVPKDAKILEVGCGTGRLLLDARNHGYVVNGLDASPDMLRLLREKAGDRYPDLELQLGEAAKLPYEDDSFDLTYAIRVLSPTKSRDYALRVVDEMMRVTRPGGYVMVEFHNTFRPRLGKGRLPSLRFKPNEIARHGSRAGGTVTAYRGAFFVSMQAYSVTPTFFAGALGAIDKILSRLFPRLCARAYVLFQKSPV